MTERDGQLATIQISGRRRYVPLAVCAIIFFVLLLIPFKIISYGYMPYDDALRHSAKAVCGKPWSEILVLGDWYKVDHNFGWHLFLRQIHLFLKVDADWLVVFSIVFLFISIGWSALPWLRRPEAWLVALLLVGLVATPERIMFGRPFILTMCALSTILLLWNKHSSRLPGWRTVMGFTLLIATAVFVHGTWYLWVLPTAAFFLARQYRWGLALAISSVIGTVLGATLTGHPVDYIFESVQMAFKAIGGHQITSSLADELRPGSINPIILFMLIGWLVARKLANLGGSIIRNPAFWLVCLGLLLGLKVQRFWYDWGMPAMLVLFACDGQLFLEKHMTAGSSKRVVLSGVLAVATYLMFTSDHGYRWTRNLINQNQYLTQTNPELDGWLPGKGGIFYTADMSMFYRTFLKNPNADWRYIVGFEPTLMPASDFKTFRQILTTYDWQDYKPWVEKMKPEDRLFIPGSPDVTPQLPELEWKHLGQSGIWGGRLRQKFAVPETRLFGQSGL